MKLILATKNQDKIKEIRELLSNLDISILTYKELNDFPITVEDKDTLTGNAEKKARNVWEKFNIPCVADDTGLFVKALDGKPGVKSSRFAGEDPTYEENRKKLLKEMKNTPPVERDAEFRTVVVFFDENGKAHNFSGVCKGFISEKATGDHGFGYDPVFHPLGSNRSFSELSSQEKNKISHRGIAMRKFYDFLQKNY